MKDRNNFYYTLYTMSRSLLMQQKVDDVLKSVISQLQKHFPFASMYLYMSQETTATDLPVLPLSLYLDGKNLCSKAFLKGEAEIEGSSVYPTQNQNQLRTYAAAVPLLGKQGIYGVLEVRSNQQPFLQEDINLLIGIGEIGGTAFENAKLYEQTNVLVTELLIINEITKRLNASLKKSEIFHFACNELIKVFQADFGCILELDETESFFSVKTVNVNSFLHRTYDCDRGCLGLLYRTKEPIIVSDLRNESRFEPFFMSETNLRSLIASPIIVDEKVVGVIVVGHAKENYFSFDNYKLLSLLADHIGLAIMKAHLHSELNRLVITDNLTGLYARRYLDDQVNAMQMKDDRGSLIVADIDNFKQVNDTFGHQIGDHILKQVSEIVRSSIRESDIAARWGGEELAIYLPQIGLEQAERIASRICSRVERETNPAVTVSCGVADWSREDDKISVETLFYKADMALYSAKNNGKNQYYVG